MADNTDSVNLKGRLQAIVAETFARNRELSAEKVAWPIIDAIWPKIEELQAQILEYEHAIEHVTDDHTGKPHCEDCQRLCQSALDGVNRADFLEIARDE